MAWIDACCSCDNLDHARTSLADRLRTKAQLDELEPVYRPRVVFCQAAVVVMNPLPANEVGRDLRAMGVSPEILVDEPR